MLLDPFVFFQYTLDCVTRPISSFPDVVFFIAGQSFVLKPLHYILILRDDSNNYTCYSVFIPTDINDTRGNLFWILGNYFLFRFYSVFDIENNRTGLARSISYDWTPVLDPVLFNGSVTILNPPSTSAIPSTTQDLDDTNPTSASSSAVSVVFMLSTMIISAFASIFSLFWIKTVWKFSPFSFLQ